MRMGKALASNRVIKLRAAAMYGLADLGDAKAVDVLLDGLDDEDWNVRALAARGLGRLKDDRALPRLVRALRTDVPEVRGEAAGALGLLTGQTFGEDGDAWAAWLAKRK